MKKYFWNSKELVQMHIELTNACNAACPMCVRFHNNSPLTRPDLEIGQITFEKFKQYFSPKILKQCNLILFCGVHGDACVARDFYEICEYISEITKGNTIVRVNTNGGMRNAKWWEKVGKLFSKHKNWHIIFSIDGLEDTNHLYRRNVIWDKLISNVKAYLQNGAVADWDFLIFKHNEHQINEAKKYSEILGFREFIPKKALGVDDSEYLEKMPALNKQGKLDYVIEAPLGPKNRNLETPKGTKEIKYSPFSFEQYQKLKKDKSSRPKFQQQVDNVYVEKILNQDNSKYNNIPISCKSKRPGGKEIFVDNFGRVMPCCYVGTHLNGVYNDLRTLQLHNHIKSYGWRNFDLNLKSLEEILDEGHLDNVFAKSWSKSKVEDGRLAYCADTCGVCSSIDRIFSHEMNDKSRFDKK